MDVPPVAVWGAQRMLAVPGGIIREKGFTAMLVNLGFKQFTGALAAAKSLAQINGGAIPEGATIALVAVENQSVRWRDDGTDPTATVGHLLTAGTYVWFTQWLSKINFIQVTAGATLTVSFYKQA